MARWVALFVWALLARTTYATDCGDGPVPARSLLFEDVIFTGTVKEHVNSFARFRVTEAFKGAGAGAYINVLALEHRFSDGGRYLVFANRCPDGTKGCLVSEGCASSYPLEYAQAVLEQLRAEKNGRRVASVYGMLWRSASIAEDGYVRLLARIGVKVRSGSKTFETKTDALGAYAFQDLPEGTYRISVDAPPNLELGQALWDYPIRPFTLTPQESYERNLSVLPKGRIMGTVLQPDGKPLESGIVSLYVAGEYKAGLRSGLKAYSVPFQFDHVAPGDYIAVYGGGLYRETFHPSGHDVQQAGVIHLGDGQQITGADIQLGNASPPR